MRYLIFVLLSVSMVFGENPYNGIVERNAFELTEKKPTTALPAVPMALPDVYLTGIVRKNTIHTAHMVIKDKTQNKFLGLSEGERKYGVEVMKIAKDTVFISHNGLLRELTFQQNSFPSTVTKIAIKSNTKDKREEREGRGRSTNSPQKASRAPSRSLGPQVVTVTLPTS